MSDTRKTALILGASRGLGLGLTEEFLNRNWSVVATARGESTGLAALGARFGDALAVHHLDITMIAGGERLRNTLGARTIDILFVNAGVMDDKADGADVAPEEFARLMITNALSPMHMVGLFADQVAPDGVIGVMSSGLGSVTNNTSGGYDAYRASKAALNTLLRSFANRSSNCRAHLAISPGWVKTDMGGAGASLEVATAMRGVTEVLISHIGHPGCAFLDYKGSAVAW